MCGIAGVLRFNGAEVGLDAHASLRAMGAQIAHRGPDDEQLYCDGPLGVLFRRLSIVDLPGGRQPLFNEDGTLMLVVNGEIYNYPELYASLRDRHHFRSRSDSEVILHLYEEHGLGFLDRLNGMYAIALWDRREQRLILARDRLGIKPLYYSVSGDRLIFGSEVKALLAWPDCPREADWEGALSTSMDVYRGGPISYFKGIEYLPGGSVLVADPRRGTTTVRKYWDPPRPTEDELRADARSNEEIVTGYREILEDAVHINFRADVEVGVFLSGGIDSVSVSALAAQDQPFHTFSVLSLSTLTNGDAGAAHRAAQHLGLPNHQVLFRWQDRSFSPEEWKRLLWLCETPQCGAEHLYKYHLHRYARANRPGLKVMLTGQGSDELNGGYCRSWLSHMPADEQSWAGFMDLLRTYERKLVERSDLSFIDKRFGFPLLRTGYLASLGGRELSRHPWLYNTEYILNTLQQYNLWHEDRTAAGNSIENRVPFLDHRLVEYCLRVPPAKYEALFWEKRILRDAVSPHVPAELRERPKCPFFHGDDARYTNRMMYDLLVAEDQALVREALGEVGADHPVLDRRAIDRAIAELPGDPEYGGVEDLFLLINMALLEKMARELPMAPAAVDPPEALPEVLIEDWEAQEPQLALQLARRRADIDLDQVPVFPANTYLVREDNVAKTSPVSLLVVDEKIKFFFDEAECGDWVQVLRRVDGKRTLREILAELQVGEADVRKFLEEALDYRVIAFAGAAG